MSSTSVKSDPLFHLIKILSKAEKRNFKLYAKRQAGNTDAKFILLFDTLDSMEEYDEEKILKKVHIKKVQLPNMKAHLYTQVLISSRLISVKHNVSIQLHEQIDFARILYDKGLYKQSLKLLDKAKKAALESEMFTIALEIVEFEKNIETLHITRSATQRAEQLSIQTTDLCRIIDSTNRLSNISIQLYSLYLKLGYVRSKRDMDLVESFFRPKLDEYLARELTFTERMLVYQAEMWYTYIRYDFVGCYKYSAKTIELFESNPSMIPLYYDLLIKSFSRNLESLFLLGSYERLIEKLEKFEQEVVPIMCSTNSHAEVMAMLALYFNKIHVIFITGTFSENKGIIEPIEAFLHEYGHHIDTYHKTLFYYKIACLYFGMGDYANCIGYLQKIINTKDSSIRRDVQCFARILNLIASYESGQDTNLDYQIRNVYAYLVKMNDMHAVQKEMIAFLKKLNTMYAADFKKELKVLYNKLLPYESHAYERRPFLYLDVLSWLESKIRDKDIESIIQEKFTKSKRISTSL